MTRASRMFRIASVPILLLICLFLLPRCHVDGAPSEEKYVTVRLNDSLSKYAKLEVLVLEAGDTSKVVGTVFTGRMENPADIPAYRLDAGETREMAVRVRGYDTDGKLVMDILISKASGRQTVVSVLPAPIIVPDTIKDVPLPSVRLASLAVSPGVLEPAFDSSVNDYVVRLAYEQTSIVLVATPANPAAAVRIEGAKPSDGFVSEPQDLLVGDNEILVRVTSGTRTGTYAVRAIRAARTPRDTLTDTTGLGPDHKDPLFQAWKHKSLITVNIQSLGLGTGSKVMDFPLLVRLNKDNFNFSQAADSGRDLRVSKADGALLEYQITRWDTAAERAELWVRVDTIRGDRAFTPLNLYWGNPAAPTVSDGAKVFTAEAGHSGVWHLGESGKGNADEFKDAMGKNHGTGYPGKAAAPRRSEGVVAHGADFKFGSTGTSILLPPTFDPGPDAWTFQAWIKMTGTGIGVIFSKGDSWDPDLQRFQIIVQEGYEHRLALQRTGATFLTDIYLPDQAFIHVGIVYDGSRAVFFVDGFERESMPWTQGPFPNGRATFGALNANGDDQPFDGILDELHFSSVARSTAWMRMSFENQKTYSYLVSVVPP